MTSTRAVADSIFITRLEVDEPGTGVAVKDLFNTAGVRTTYGSAVFRDHVPTSTATAVTRLEAAGYVNAGKANLHEFAWGITSENEHYGWVPNPRAPGRVAGGSSGGSAAAIVAGEAEFGLGTDSGGSVRIPAACCGITGFKPSFGLIPIDGCFPLAPSYDHVGPLARDVAGCERMMQALAPGLASVDVTLDDLAIGIAWSGLADPLVRRRVEQVAAGCRPVELPLPPKATYPEFMREAAVVHDGIWREHRALYGENVAAKIERAMRVTDAEAEQASRERAEYVEQLLAAMDGFDLVLTPTLTMVAPPAGVGDLALREAMIRLTIPWNMAGAPALALPCGPAELDLPASVQLVGRPGDDGLVLAAGRALEARIGRMGT